MSDKISKLFKSIEQYMPYLMKDEMQKREVMRWLEKSLKEQAAKGEEQRKTIEASSQSALKQAYVDAVMDAVKKRVLPEHQALAILKRVGISLPGITMPPTAEQEIEDAVQSAVQTMKYQQAGEIVPEEVALPAMRYLGPEMVGGVVDSIVKQREAEKERGVRGREIGVQEAIVPIRKGELAVSLKKLAGEIGDMTQKEARDELAKRGVERRRYQAMLQTKTDESGMFLEEGELNQIKGNIEEIKKLEDKIKSKFALDEPAAKPSAHQKGEKKTVIINGTPATYIWNGEKWILSNSGQ